MVVVSQLATQAIRFGSNVVLAALLSPAIFGVLALVTAVRTGVELLTDMGISQSIVVSDSGDEREFVETAWGLQVARGLALAGIGALVSFPMAWLYGQSELGPLLLVGSLGSIISGLARPGPALLQRSRQMDRLIVQRLAVAVSGALISIAFAAALPTAMSLIMANVVALCAATIVSYLILPLPGYRPRILPVYQRKIVSFGKWIFLSSVVYFFATNFDRLYLPAHIPLAVFGVYGIARSLADVVVQTVVQVNQLVVLPAVVQSKNALHERRARLGRMRFFGLAAIDAAIGLLIASSDLIILTVFDARYSLGAVILPILLVGSWFAIHASVCEFILLGLGNARPMLGGNSARFISAVLGLPLAFSTSGLLAGIVVIAFSDLPRFAWLTWQAARQRVSFASQDPLLFTVMIGTALGARELFVAAGLADGMISSVQRAGLGTLLGLG
jgi:O-antigen/teichoic acid export membrane protein